MDKEEPRKGLGVKWEGGLIYNHIYNNETKNSKFIPLLFHIDDKKYIPTPLSGATHYVLDAEQGYEKLYRRVTNQTDVTKPALGKLKELSAGNQGLCVISKRVAVKDLEHKVKSSVKSVQLENLSDAAGTELLKEAGVKGTDQELKEASNEFNGHALALNP